MVHARDMSVRPKVNDGSAAIAVPKLSVVGAGNLLITVCRTKLPGCTTLSSLGRETGGVRFVKSGGSNKMPGMHGMLVLGQYVNQYLAPRGCTGLAIRRRGWKTLNIIEIDGPPPKTVARDSRLPTSNVDNQVFCCRNQVIEHFDHRPPLVVGKAVGTRETPPGADLNLLARAVTQQIAKSLQIRCQTFKRNGHAQLELFFSL
jgi:hypothetical protein